MKKFNLLLITMLISTVLFAQKLAVSEVPAQVMNEFKSKFPVTEKAVWEKDNANIKVAFFNDGNKMEVVYQNYNWQQTKWVIAIEYAPQKIKDYLKQYYAVYKIKEIGFVEKSSGDRVYDVQIAKKKKDTLTLVFDSNNSFLLIEGEVKDTKEVKKAN